VPSRRRAPADLSRARIAILGCGAVGRALAHGLAAAPGYRGTLVLWSRRAASVRAARRGLPAARVRTARSAAEAVRGARVVLWCVAEGATEALLAALGPPPAGVQWLVASGSLPLARLARLRTRGGGVARCHPLAPFPRGGAGRTRGIALGIEGGRTAVAAAEALARWLDARVLRLRPGAEAAARYHAGAALLGGGLVALWALVEELLASEVRGPRAALRGALESFVDAVAAEARGLGPARALTGPIARGAEATVGRHLETLRRASPEAAEAYRRLGQTMLVLAAGRGGLEPRVRARLEALLRPRSSRARRGP